MYACRTWVHDIIPRMDGVGYLLCSGTDWVVGEWDERKDG
jgi:hypothetical protein